MYVSLRFCQDWNRGSSIQIEQFFSCPSILGNKRKKEHPSDIEVGDFEFIRILLPITKDADSSIGKIASGTRGLPLGSELIKEET